MPAKRRRVLFLVPSFAGGVGGAERVFSLILQHLDPARFELHLALAQARNSHLDNLPPYVTVHDLKLSRMRYAVPALVRIVRRLEPDVVLSTVSYLNAMLLFSSALVPKDTRLIVREAIMPSAFIAQEARHPRFWRWAYRNLYPKADTVICLSDSMLVEMSHEFAIPRSRLVRIYNPVDVQGISERSCGENPFVGQGPHLVTAGRLQRQKGIDILLNAMPAVLQKFPGATLTVLGEGPLEAGLKGQAEQLRIAASVNFPGFQPDPWRYVKHADVFILPSRFEGTPNALLESIGLGTPAIATACPGGVREIAASFHQVVLVPPEDPAALAAAAINLLRNPRDRSAPRTLGEFDLQKVIENYSNVLLQPRSI